MKTRGFVSMVRNRLRRKEIYSQAEYWNAKAVEHDARPASMWPNDALNGLYHAEQLRMLAERLPDVRGWRALDVGCGTGRLSRYFAARGARVTGMDFAANAVAKALAAPLPEPAEAGIAVAAPEYRIGSVFELADGPEYDVAFTWGVLTMACRTRDDFRRALARILAALKPGGRLLLFEPFHRGPLRRVLGLRWDDAVADVRAAGAEPTAVRGMHFWPARVLLGYLPWPRLVTAPAYAVGQRLLGSPRWGDYQMIDATRLQ